MRRWWRGIGGCNGFSERVANAGFYDRKSNNVPIGAAHVNATSTRRQPADARLDVAWQRDPIDRYDRHLRASHGSDARDTGGMLAAQRKSGSFPDA
ncbi:hypothetical protein [Burkholderia cepacia]|nr:hypothetical protein [Burkholderia cepacia]MDN7632816.1 hypothetical protein [Burkholderia cepacia]